MDYMEKLRDGRWQKKRLSIFERDGFQCVVCGKLDNIQVHHNWYVGKRDPWEYSDDQLVTLCDHHHDSVSKVQSELKLQLSLMGPAKQMAALEILKGTLNASKSKVGSVELTATNSDSEPFRLKRLEQCVSMLRELDSMACLTLLRLHDQKGCLEATWSTFTPDDACRQIEKVWRELGEHDVKHFFLEVQ